MFSGILNIPSGKNLLWFPIYSNSFDLCSTRSSILLFLNLENEQIGKDAYSIHLDLSFRFVLDVKPDPLVEPEKVVLDGGPGIFDHENAYS